MADLLTGEQVLAKQVAYLEQERDRHKRDISTNEGKVQEIEELIRVCRQMCLYCGKEVYKGWDQEEGVRMAEHVAEMHSS
tara:strand:- start:2333 stop:2572 length:240 start_codon:yes stop_codon:yes gene_type:complete